MCLPSPGFESLPPEQGVPPIGIPDQDGAQSALMSISAMTMVVHKNEVKGNLEYEYETHYLGPLCPESPEHGPTITELLVVE